MTRSDSEEDEMADETRDQELSPEELAQQQGEPLPDREVMSTLPIDDGSGAFADIPIGDDRPMPIDEPGPHPADPGPDIYRQ